jgi:hypothetical protein
MNLAPKYGPTCPRVFDNRQEPRSTDYAEPEFDWHKFDDYDQKKKAWEKKGIPDYLICTHIMNRVYIRSVFSYSSRFERMKTTRRFAPLGYYCTYCGLFCTDEQYPELMKEQLRITERDDQTRNNKYHIGRYHKKQVFTGYQCLNCEQYSALDQICEHTRANTSKVKELAEEECMNKAQIMANEANQQGDLIARYFRQGRELTAKDLARLITIDDYREMLKVITVCPNCNVANLLSGWNPSLTEEDLTTDKMKWHEWKEWNEFKSYSKEKPKKKDKKEKKKRS